MTYVPPLPKPCQVPRKSNAFLTFPDGREVCTKTKAGFIEWRIRRLVVFDRDHGVCQIPGCTNHKRMQFQEGTADHIIPRGMGGSTRDDRIANLRWAHWECNMLKGSQRDAVLSETIGV